MGQWVKKNRNNGHKKGQWQGQRYYRIYRKPGHNTKTYKKGNKKGNPSE